MYFLKATHFNDNNVENKGMGRDTVQIYFLKNGKHKVQRESLY